MTDIVKITGRVIDADSQVGISGVKVSLDKYSTTTDSKGSYTLNITNPNQDFTRLKYTKSSYTPITNINPYTLGNKLRTSINVQEMDIIKKSLDKEISKLQVMSESTVNQLKKFGDKSPEGIIIEQLGKQVSNLEERAIPYALGIISSFGITKLDQMSAKTCPPITDITNIINKKNKLTRQLNNSYTSITSVKNLGVSLTALTTAFTIIYKLFKINPIPSTIGTPPGIAGGVIYSTPLGKITTIDEKREKAKQLIDRLKNLSKSITPSLIPIGVVLTKLIGLLEGIDTSTGDCLNGVRQQVKDELGDDVDFNQISNNKLKSILGLPLETDIDLQNLLSGDFLQIQLNQELTQITQDTAQDGQPSIIEYNGFILSVVTESEESAQGKSIKRRFAIAKDKNGVTLLQGVKSYSSNDQILIDELIFKIEQEDLTPY